MINTLGSEAFVAPKLRFKQLAEEVSLTLKSSRAKEELSNLSPVFSIHETTQHTTRKHIDQEISAWTESELPCASPTARKATSVLRKRKQSPLKERLLPQGKRSRTSCLTQCDIDNNRAQKKRQMTLSKISFYEEELPFQSIGSNAKLIAEVSSLQRLKHPFKSNILLSMMKKRKYTCSNVPVRERQKRTSERFQVEDLFKDERRGSKSKLLNFIKNINKLRLKEKSDSKLERVHLL